MTQANKYDALADSYFDSRPDLLPHDIRPSVQAGTITTPVNKYDSLADSYFGAVDQAAKGSLVVNEDANPDTAARAQELSQILKLPPVVIESDLPGYEAKAKAIRDNAAIAGNPILSSWVANNREKARVAQDDFDKLGVLSKTWTAFKGGYSSALESNKLGRLYNVKEIGDTFGVQTPDTNKEIAETESNIASRPDMKLGGGYGFLQDAGGFISGTLDNFLSSLPEAAGGAALGTVASGPAAPIGATAGAVIGAGIGFKVDMARVAAGLNYRATENVKDSQGNALSQTSRNVGALLTGALTYAIAGAKLKIGSDVTNEAVSHFTSEAVTQAMTRPTVVTAMTNLTKSIGTGAAKGAALGGAMEFSNILGEEVAKGLSKGDFHTILNDPETRSLALERLADAAESGAIMFGAMHAVGGSLGVAGDLMRARQARIDVNTLTDLSKGALESKTRERSPETFADLMHHQADGSPVENLYIPVDKVLKLYQDAKIDPVSERPNDPLFGWVKDMPEQIKEAQEHKGDVVIPTADFITYLAGSDIGKRLMNDARVRPDAMSFNEAKIFEKAHKDAISKMAKEAPEVFPEDRIYQDVLQQTRGAGFNASEASKYAALYAARYGTRGERLGIDPWEAYQKSGVEFRNASETTEGGKSFSQDTAPVGRRTDILERSLADRLPDETSSRDMQSRIQKIMSKYEFKKHAEPLGRVNEWLGKQKGQISRRQVMDEIRGQRPTFFQDLNPVGRRGSPLERAISERLPEQGQVRDMQSAIAKMKSRSEFDKHAEPIAKLEKWLSEQKGSLSSREVMDFVHGEPQQFFQGHKKDLIIQHNLSEENLLHADRIGGIPVPSLAITRADRSITNFGEITLIGPKEMADPRGYAKPKVFGSDVYSPRYPDISYKLSEDALDKLNSVLAPYREGRKIFGSDIQKIDDLTQIDSFKKYAEKTLGDKKNTWSAIKYLAEKTLREAGAEEKIFRGFTNSGNRRYIDHNIENVVRILKKDIRSGEGFNYGVGSLRAHYTPQFRSVQGIRNNKSKLLDEKSFEKVKAEASADLQSIWNGLIPYHSQGEKFGMGDIVTDTLAHAAKVGIPRALEENQFKNVPEQIQIEMRDYLQKLKNMPTEYFEAKIPRAVQLQEFRAAVVPDNISAEALAALKRHGLKVEKYDHDSPEERSKVTEKLTEKIGEEVLFQEGARGSITFSQGKSIIDLFKDKDLSTVLHETGHLWLEELKADAKLENAPEQLKSDLATVLKHFGIENPDDIKTEHHEKFARAVETYFMEGKAPTPELASIFQRFKTWLTHIYRTLTNTGVEVSPEIREVFDRLLATDEQISHAQQSIGVFSDRATQRFRDGISGLMTKAEFSAYMKAIDSANSKAHEAILSKMMEKIKRERTSEYKSERAKVADEVTPEVDAKPEIRALNGPKIDKATVEQMYSGNEAMAYFLPKQMIAKEVGVHPDIAAEMAGYPSGDVMVKALIKAEQEKRRLDVSTGKNKSIRQHMIDQEVDKRMDAKYGDFLNSSDIEKEALSAVHNSSQEQALATELRVMGRNSDMPNIPLDQAREWARQTISNRKVGEVSSSSRYARAEDTAARKSEISLLKGKVQEAYQYKRQQILNHLLYRTAEEANKEIERGTKLMERLAGEKSFKGIDQEYTDRIHDLLQRFGFNVPRTSEEISRGIKGETLEGFANRKFDQGYELAIDPELYDPQRRGNVDQMTVDQFRSFHDAIRSLQSVGRDENTVLIGGEKVDRESAINQLVDNLKKLPQKKQSDFYKPEDAGKLKNMKDRTLAFFRSADASLLKEEQLLDWMDGGDPNGPFNKFIFRPLKESQLKADDMRRKVAKQVQDLVKEMPKKWAKSLTDEIPNDTLTNPKTGQPFKFNRKRMLSIALNMGTDDNAKKLADGYQWTEPSIHAFLNENMRQEDWNFVKNMWETVGQFRGQIDELQRRVTGVGIEFVEGRTMQTKFGDVKGGYFPLVYDPLRSPEAERHMAKSAADMFENQYYRATTSKGHTKERVQGVKRPIALDLDIIPWKIGQVIHDLSFREAIMDVGKILGDDRVRSGIDDSFGHEYTKTLRPWLQSIANSRNVNDMAVDWIDKTLRWARTNATMVGIGFRLSTMYKHGTTALSNSIGELGPKYMAQGIKEYFGTPQNMKRAHEFVLEKSGEMRNRIDHYDRDIRENLKTLLDEKGLKAEAQRYSTYGVGFLDMMSAMPTWLGGYRKALSEGHTDADAVYIADKTVRKAHGSQGLVDFSAIQRGSEFQKLLTMFYGFFNHIYNRQRDTVRQAGSGVRKVKSGDFAGARRDFAIVLARTMTYIIIPAIAETIYTHGGPNDQEDESWGAWAGKAILGEIPAGIPIIRDIAKAALEGRDYEISPVARAVSTAVGTGKDVGKALGLIEGEPSQKWLRHAIETAGYVTGWPTGQAGGSVQFLWDAVDGEQQPETLYDWYHGLAYGKVESK